MYLKLRLNVRLKRRWKRLDLTIFNKVFNDFLELNGIRRQLTVPYTPQQNGVAERFNRPLVEMARAMLVYSEVEESLWAAAVNTAAYLRISDESIG